MSIRHPSCDHRLSQAPAHCTVKEVRCVLRRRMSKVDVEPRNLKERADHLLSRVGPRGVAHVCQRLVSKRDYSIIHVLSYDWIVP